MTSAIGGTPEDEAVLFKKGHEIASPRGTYIIQKLLGAGGFGSVYLVKTPKGKSYAMKVEKKSEKNVHSKLKMEIAILKAVNGKHFTKIIDRGKNEDEKDKDKYFYLVMELVGKSLSDLKGDGPFSFGCGLSIGVQCLEAIEDLHKAGFIHRDIKPPNFTCGLDDKKHIIYMLDFGISRRYLNDRDEIKTPREKVKFKGTIKFAPLACHRNVEPGPKDDCESWLYMLLEMILPNGLPWGGSNKKETGLRKEECRRDKRPLLFKGLERADELQKCLEYIDERQYQDRVDYSYLLKMCQEAARLTGCDLDAPYDWENPATSPATCKE